MSQSVAELFVDIGVKGADVAGKTLGGINDSLKNIGTSSLEAKAALLAALYAADKLFTTSANFGHNLEEFNRETGMSAIKLQQWQKALEPLGVSTDETEQAIRGLQKTMTDLAFNHAPNEKFSLLSQMAGFTIADASKLENLFPIFEKIRAYTQKAYKTPGEKPIANAILADAVHISGTLAQGLANLPKNPEQMGIKVLNQHELDNLEKLYKTIIKIKQELKLLQDQFAATFGPTLAGNLAGALKEIENIFTAISAFNKDHPIIGTAEKGALGVAGATAFPATAATIATIGALADLSKGKDSKIDQFMKNIVGDRTLLGVIYNNLLNPREDKKETPGVTVHQTNNFHGDAHAPKEIHKATHEGAKKAIKEHHASTYAATRSAQLV